MTPNKQRIRKWVDALRSGEYRQGYHQLRNNEGFCCLGVACDVAIRNGLDAGWVLDPDGGGAVLGEAMEMPLDVQRWFGIDDSNPVPTKGGKGKTLAERNDQGWSFKRIADAIERKYLR